jgi:uncharacterized protein
MPDDFQIFIKPVGATCNLDCSYCYYLGKKDLYPDAAPLRMADIVLERYIKQHIEASTDQKVFFSWHGGEPLLAGLDFYKKAVALQKKYLPSGRAAINGVQTNGTLLNDEWCRYFKSENFVVGISIDGPEELHNIYRLNLGGRPVFSDVMKGHDLLMKYEIPSEILCVVSSGNSGHPHEVYNFFRGTGASYITFLPLVERSHPGNTIVSDRSVKPEDFGFFLSDIFDEWIENDIGRINIQVFDEALREVFNRDHTLCIFKVDCGAVPVLEHNGDFFSCDHFVNPANLVGNIMETTISQLLKSQRQIEFGMLKSKTLPRYCLDCEVRNMCNGECPKNRFCQSPDGEPGLNYLCPGYKIFFNHCKPFIEALRLTIIRQGSSS